MNIRYVRTAWQAMQKNWFIGLVHKFTILIFVLSVALLAWRWSRLPPLVPLWYSRPWGTDQLANPYWLLVLPVGSLIVYGVNALVSIYITGEYLIFTQILFLSSLIVSLLSAFSLIKILFLIT